MIHRLTVPGTWIDRIREGQQHVILAQARDYQAGDTIRLIDAEDKWKSTDRRIAHVLHDNLKLTGQHVALSLVDPLRERAESAEKSNAPLRGTITRLTRELKEARDA
ncbi:hypothetical protein FK268_12805 [Tsukamurella sputi]|uniref:Uncharacterized protein n=1 Tax=Tsukamurella sputi TaxID=2591848 RepID=A0A5C5RL52_9ACTN|nr:hypothetical protein [Tsukamurella sputi]TWS23193.1 hypothetical protein FK268_12805 [Tsukamurella sputi]